MCISIIDGSTYQCGFANDIVVRSVLYSHIYSIMKTFAELLDYFQSFSKGCRIIRRAKFLKEVWYMKHWLVVEIKSTLC